jgi:hypothetical protein
MANLLAIACEKDGLVRSFLGLFAFDCRVNSRCSPFDVHLYAELAATSGGDTRRLRSAVQDCHRSAAQCVTLSLDD